MSSVSVLFCRRDSNYKKLGVDVWDIDRDAMRWPGGNSLIAHPPCAQWGRLRQFATPDPKLKQCSIYAAEQVRRWGGVLEHPYLSRLWDYVNLPLPGDRDQHGGWTLPISQFWFGHPCEKMTWLYIVGCDPDSVPAMPIVIGRPERCIKASKGRRLPVVTKAEREHTPIELARWLISIARICNQIT